MRYIYVSLLSGLLLTLSPASFAQPRDCADKQREIEQQIAYAKQYRQDARVTALEVALANNKANCTDTGLMQKHEDNVKEKQAKVDKAARKLEEATARGKPGKIKERTEELERAQKALAIERASSSAK